MLLELGNNVKICSNPIRLSVMGGRVATVRGFAYSGPAKVNGSTLAQP